MKPSTLLFLMLALSACGLASADQPGKPGISTSPEYKAFLEAEYRELQDCTGLKGDPVDTLSIEIFPSMFPCPHNNFCSGQFIPPNIIRLSASMVWRHEGIHYLLFKNSEDGDADPEHKSHFFKDCS